MLISLSSLLSLCFYWYTKSSNLLLFLILRLSQIVLILQCQLKNVKALLISIYDVKETSSVMNCFCASKLPTVLGILQAGWVTGHHKAHQGKLLSFDILISKSFITSLFSFFQINLLGLLYKYPYPAPFLTHLEETKFITERGSLFTCCWVMVCNFSSNTSATFVYIHLHFILWEQSFVQCWRCSHIGAPSSKS